MVVFPIILEVDNLIDSNLFYQDISGLSEVECIKLLDRNFYYSSSDGSVEDLLTSDCIVYKSIESCKSCFDTFYNVYVDFIVSLELSDGSSVLFNYRKFIDSIF